MLVQVSLPGVPVLVPELAEAPKNTRLGCVQTVDLFSVGS